MTISPPSFVKDPRHETKTETTTPTTATPGSGRARWILGLVVPLVALVAVVLAVLVRTSPEDAPSRVEEGGGTAPSPTAYDEAYGAFESFETTGTGTRRIALPARAKAGIVTARYDGPGAFDVGYLQRSGQAPAAWSLIAWTGAQTPYRGSVPFGLDRRIPARSLWVWADGPWVVTISPLSSADVLPATASGTGDAVFLYDGEAAEWAVEHEGPGYFAIRQWRADGWADRSLSSGVGSYVESARALAGPSVVSVHADGPWSITVE
jgi:hypothetical protein